MYENVVRLQEIKNLLNRKIKLIKISFIGIKSDTKKINIESVLQNLSNQNSIPNSEGFLFFDFQNAREELINSNIISDEFRILEINRINEFESEFNKFKSILIKIENFKNQLDRKFIKGTYKDLKLIFPEALSKIDEFNKDINIAKSTINRDKFGEGITSFIQSFKYKIRGELARHNIQESETLANLLDKCFKTVKDTDRYLNKIEIQCKYIVDISDELLTDTSFINSLVNMELDDEYKNLITEYYNLSK